MTRKKKQEAEQKPEYEWRSDRPERPALYNVQEVSDDRTYVLAVCRWIRRESKCEGRMA